jgi:CRISPR system Cascade subunit CasD
MEALLIRLDAPLMSFGGPMVDQIGAIQEHPGLSQVTGLLANALGYDHRDRELIAQLQHRISYAVRCDRRGTKLLDFHTVDLGQEHLADTGWTTAGRPESRGTGGATRGTHIRYRDFWADRVCTLALTLRTPECDPTLDRVEAAIRSPERPLFVGRKPCIPSGPLFIGRVSHNSLREALESAPQLPESRRDPDREVQAWWPAEEGDGGRPARLVTVTDARDWQNQVHCGERSLYHGTLLVEVQGGR